MKEEDIKLFTAVFSLLVKICCMKLLQSPAKLPSDISLAYLKLHETENSYGEWFAEDQSEN